MVTTDLSPFSKYGLNCLLFGISQFHRFLVCMTCITDREGNFKNIRTIISDLCLLHDLTVSLPHYYYTAGFLATLVQVRVTLDIWPTRACKFPRCIMEDSRTFFKHDCIAKLHLPPKFPSNQTMLKKLLYQQQVLQPE